MKNKFILIAVTILVAALTRLLPHPTNVAPIMAIALFGGAVIENKWLKFILPFVALLLSDFVLNTWVYNLPSTSLFYDGFYMQYICIALVITLGYFAVNTNKPSSILASSVAGSVLFFIVSNFGVWTATNLYTHTSVGLINCYTAAIPFFSNTLLGDLFYNALLFGAYAWYTKSANSLTLSPINKI